MEILERIWEILGMIFGGTLRWFERSITALFGSSNARYVRALMPKVAAVAALEDKYKIMSDEVLKDQTRLFRERLAKGETLDSILVEAFAVCREAGRRWLAMRHYDVQMIGGMVLHSGRIGEMVTGEGKTLVATLPAYLNALAGSVHVVTVNDYLARRDMEWMGPLYMGLGLTVGAIQNGMESGERQKAYSCDITYGTNNEFGFDYLRDNMKQAARGDSHYDSRYQQCQGPLTYAIIDEVDNILIDEARTPLIISGPAHGDVTKYPKADKIARQLKRDVHFEIKEKEHTVHLTEEGVREAEKLAGVESFYTAGNMEWPHLIDNALKAHHLYKRDVNYMIDKDEIIIVDEFTGRPMPGRNWSDGLHQAVESKEGVKVKEENQTLATITLQNFFKLYKKLSGMTGTAMTEAGEFWKIYKLDVVAIPTNRGLKRITHPDVIFRTENEKWNALVEEIERINKWDVVTLKDREVVGDLVEQNDKTVVIKPHDPTGSKKNVEKESFDMDKVVGVSRRGRPILVGTITIEKSEKLSGMLDRRGVKHEVLNAKHHSREADIIAQAGRKSAVTIATNMAGRGTDIILGGNPENMAWSQLQTKYATRLDVPREEWDALVKEIEEREHMKTIGREVASMGGLHVIGTERHEARRIDLQLMGRCGRQGDPGSSRFYLSLDDDLMRIFAGDWVKNVLSRLGMQEGEAIESRMVSKRIEAAQKKVEERNFETRKHLLEYDEVMDEQRKRVYGYRQRILDGSKCKDLVLEMVDNQIAHHLSIFLNPNFGAEEFALFAGKQLGVQLEPRDFKNLQLEAADTLARDEAERQAEGQVLEALEENLPQDAEDPEHDWNWEALARWANTRWTLNLRDKDLKKSGRDEVGEVLLERAREAIGRIDLKPGEQFLSEDWGKQTTVDWVEHKFAVNVPLDEIKPLDRAAIEALVKQKARKAYEDREVEFPVLAGLYGCSVPDGQGHRRYDREQLVSWARQRFNVTLDIEDLKNKQSDEVQAMLLEHSRRSLKQADEALAKVHDKLAAVFAGTSIAERSDTTLAVATGGNGALESLTQWIERDLEHKVAAEDLRHLTRDQLRLRLEGFVDDRYRPEIRRMEREVVLQLLDSSWKEHLLSMDHLRSGIGLMSYAQVDPKVEYKKEGMRIFELMWRGFGDRVTDLVFRMEQLDENFVGSIWKESAARKEAIVIPGAAPAASGEGNIGAEQDAAIKGTENTAKPEPIRNRQDKVGRNDPCPCGSGKKYKNCHMKSR